MEAALSSSGGAWRGSLACRTVLWRVSNQWGENSLGINPNLVRVIGLKPGFNHDVDSPRVVVVGFVRSVRGCDDRRLIASEDGYMADMKP